jgi:polyhydroxybutyrate depolymerase
MVAAVLLVAATACSSQPRGAIAQGYKSAATEAPAAAPSSLPPESVVTAAAVIATASALNENDDARTDEVSMIFDRKIRTARVRLPARLMAAKAPLVVVLHGSDGSAAGMEELTGYDEVADREGFLVAYADGLPVDIGAGFIAQSWNSGECCEPATSNRVDDVGFLSKLIDKMIARFPVDPDRVFIVGHSNGAIMAQMLGCQLADRLAGIASVAGALDDTSTCEPTRPVPFLEIHGTDDEDVAWSAGENGVSYWRQFNGCGPQEIRNDAPGVTTMEWSRCRDGGIVKFITIDGANHPWPGRREPSPDGLPVSFAVDAAESTWSFFASLASRTASHRG